MEAILATQEQIVSAMEALRSNFRKDGSERKTPAYIEKRLGTLEAYWNEFQTNHARLCSEFDDPNHKYFKDNYYQSTYSFYNDTKALFIKYEQNKPLLRPATPLSHSSDRHEPKLTTQGNSSRVDDMLRKQKTNFKAFLHTIDSVDLENLTEQWEFEDLLRNINSRWSTIDSLHWEIDCESLMDNEEYEQAYIQYELKYNSTKRAVNNKMCSISFREKSTPHLDIPTFSGNYQQWISFKDLFSETIHRNKSLPNAQKMQHLKNKLRGEASKLVQHLAISSDNYQVCWDILNHRYNNMRTIFNSHVQILLSLPSMQQQTAAQIKKLHDTTNECLNAIKAMGVDITSWDPLIVYILSQKLDTETHHDYIESLKNPRDLATISEFLDFLETKFISLESCRRKPDFIKPKQAQFQENYIKNRNSFTLQNNKFMHKVSQPNPVMVNHASTTPISQRRKCILCNNLHALFQCKLFLESKPEERRKIIDNNDLCKNCLINHSGKGCKSEKTCRFCNGNHNTLLHNAYVTYAPSTSSPATETPKSNIYISQAPQDTIPKLLATAKVNIKSEDGRFYLMRALIDPCAESSLITENAAQVLGLPRVKRDCMVVGVGSKTNNSKGVVKITISSLYNDFTIDSEAYVMKHVVDNLPSQSFRKPSWPQIETLSLADPDFNISKPVDLILGVEVYELILRPGFIRNGVSQPIAQNTELGWILSGSVTTQSYCNVVKVNLNNIQRYWEIEDITDNSSDLSNEDQHCMQHYQLHTKRQPDGRYIVRLPLKPDVAEKLGESKTKAIAQFCQLEKKFTKNKIVSENYKDFINEYLSLNHMVKCVGNQTPESYLPHHCVLRAGSSTTATRVVFNASAKTSTGYSLNDLMYSGPNLQKDLLTLIIGWRQYQIAFTADIEKMFRQILVHEKDQALQKIIWRDHHKQPLGEYQLATVTYGTKAAPFLAMMTLKQLAKDEAHRFPEAAEVVNTSFYMDDLLHGHHDLQSAIKLKADLVELLRCGGFNLRKWSSNRLQLQECPLFDQTYIFKHQESTKALGLQWHSREDQFSFEVKPESPTKLTKRTLLSSISKIFDPLGWLSPTTTNHKLLFQEIWVLDLQWDDVLPDSITSRWKTMEKDLININQIKIPRWLHCIQDDTLELHGFCDASEKAYACVIYCRVNSGAQPSVVIIAAKSRLVPAKKTISLPRLELCAAVLLSRLMKTTCQCLSNFNIKIYGWSDSTAVLGWLKGEPSRWKPFVANRVNTVVDIIPSDNWRYVKSKDNPADCASRGITAAQLATHNIWWDGPTWLKSFEENTAPNIIYNTDEEIKHTISINTATLKRDNYVIDSILNRHSNFTRASRVLAWILRVRFHNKHTYLTIPELRKSNNLLIKHVQSTTFTEDIDYIKNHNQPNPKGKLLKLNPFMDETGILRVGGRISNASIQHNMRHPAILPHNDHLTDMIIDHAHKMTFHGGARLTLAWLRQQYWIIGGNNAVKKRIRRCVVCRKQSPYKHNQLMGDLPAARTNITRPFYHTGVDFTGFVEIKSQKGRGVRCTKGYIAVFVCMATKAIHLELVSDLTASAFISALRRFAARRGTPGHMYSDNGTNFVKANRLLQEEILHLQAIIDDKFYTEITEMQIEWHFNAPSWPSAGGLWEAAVKSLKFHLKRVIGEQRLTYEEYSTLLAQIEACLNSRPLCSLTEDPEDLDALTPAHFLSSGPTATIVETEKDLRTRWQLMQKIYQDVWKRWRAEYLTQLTARSKWQRAQPNMQIGDIVLVHDANLPPGKWALGRVVELHPGKDSFVRVVSVKTKNGSIKRPIVKLSLLPVREDKKCNQPCQSSEINQSNDDSPRLKTKTKQTKCLFNFITMALLLFTCLSSVQCSHRIINFKNNQSFYFDKLSTVHVARDDWKLIVYYDLEPYDQGMDLVKLYLDHLKSSCDNSSIKVHCESVLLQLNHSYNEIERYNNVLSSHQFPRRHARRRRGLVNAVGYVANSLFGVLDDHFAEQYKQDIDLLKTNQNHLANLWKNQTSIVEAEFNVLNRMKTSIDKQHKMFNQYLLQLENNTNVIKDRVQNVELTNEFLFSSIALNSLLANLKDIQEMLLDTISEVYYGKFNVHLLKPDQLMEELKVISGKLPKDLTLPIDILPSELPKLYHLLKVKARMAADYLIIEIKIPLANRDTYEVYKILSLPRRVNNYMVSLVPVSDYVAINLQKDSYLILNELDIKECVYFDVASQICSLRKPIYHMRADESLCLRPQKTQRCETRSLSCQDSWVQLNDVNTYLFFSCEPRQVRILCKDEITTEYLTNVGIIMLGADCMIKGKDVTIIAHKPLLNSMTLHADVLKLEIPPVNHLFNHNLTVPTSELDPVISGNDKEMESIGSQIRQMKSESPSISSISYHDMHHYVVIYLLVGAAAVAAVVCGLRRRCGRRRAASPAPPAATLGSAAAAPRPGIGFNNPVFSFSVGDQKVSVSDQSVSLSDKCVSVSEKPGPSVQISESTSPLFSKHSFAEGTSASVKP